MDLVFMDTEDGSPTSTDGASATSGRCSSDHSPRIGHSERLPDPERPSWISFRQPPAVRSQASRWWASAVSSGIGRPSGQAARQACVAQPAQAAAETGRPA